MSERALLLGLMRTLRRRRRWSDAATGAAFGVAVFAAASAAAIPLVRWRGFEPGVAAVLAVLAGGALGAAVARGARRLSLAACARAVDRALGALEAGDRVFAAVSFAESGMTASPFVAAVTADAWARARTVSARRIVPRPPAQPFVLAAVGVVAVMALLVGPRLSSRASTSAGGTPATNGIARTERDPAVGTPPVLRMPAVALDAEREDVASARAAAYAAGDVELARMADEMARLLAALSGAGTESESAVKRAHALAADAHSAATEARVAEAAAKASRAALGASGRGGDVGAAAAALANAIGGGEASTEAAARLAAEGTAGRSALARAAAAAAAALDRGAGGSTSASGDGPAPGEGAKAGDDASARRRLDDGRGDATGAPERAEAGRGTNQRQLQKLSRDLDRAAADCRRDPEACRRNAGGTGRALDQLGRTGQTAQARTRLAQSAQQLLDRLQRGGGGAGEAKRMRSFSRAARAGVAPPRGAVRGAGQPEGGASPSAASMAGEDPDRAMTPDDTGAGRGGDDSPSSGSSDNQAVAEGEGRDSNAGQAGGTTRSDEGVGAAVAGSGIGSGPGGPVLGTRTPGGAGAGRDAPTAVASGTSGPSRSTVIGGAASAGFASADYRRVFSDYASAVEESLDSAAVPPGRRTVVRRYFQLIRPRGP